MNNLNLGLCITLAVCLLSLLFLSMNIWSSERRQKNYESSNLKKLFSESEYYPKTSTEPEVARLLKRLIVSSEKIRTKMQHQTRQQAEQDQH